MAKRTVLIVDPDTDTRVILRAFLEHRGFQVLDCGDATAGLALAGKHHLDLVIGDFPLDVPGHSPFREALRDDVRSDAAVLVLTTRTLPDQAAAARAAGDAMLVKPARLGELLKTINRLLGRPPGDS